MDPSSPIHIVGAGPVGSVLACLLGRQGRDVHIWEKRTDLPDCSMAIGITPPSLDLLDNLGLGDRFREHGVFIRRAHVTENGTNCGTLDFRSTDQGILSLPQAGTLQILRQEFQKYPNVTYDEGTAYPEKNLSDAPCVIACDGTKSMVREAAGILLRTHDYRVRFVMADFPDHEHLGPDARLYFSDHGAVESFPLPDDRRRWIVQLSDGDYPLAETLVSRVKDLAGIDLSDREHTSLWPFDPHWALADNYVRGNIILCGDAAHQMSPIGGQGMNTGFADALHLSHVLANPTPTALASYTRVRQRAFRSAARRAALGMWLGTRTGPGWSRIRRTLIKSALHTQPVHQTLARTFTMRNLPT